MKQGSEKVFEGKNLTIVKRYIGLDDNEKEKAKEFKKQKRQKMIEKRRKNLER